MVVAIALVFLAINIYIGFLVSKWIRSSTDFLVAGREVKGFVQFCSFAAINFAGSNLVAIPAFVVTVGFWPAVWWNIGLGLIYMLLAFTSMKLLRRSGVYTINEWIEIRFGKGARRAIAVGQFVGLIFGGAANIAGVGLAMGPLVGWNFATTAAVTSVAFTIYMLMAGAWGNTVNDTLQFLFGVALYVAVLLFALVTFGLPVNNYDPARMFAFPGGAPLLGLGEAPTYLYGIFGWFLFSFTAQHYYVKCAAVRSERAVVLGTFGAGVFAIVWAFMVGLIGLYAIHLTPGGIPANQALGAFAKFTAQLPTLLAALIVLGYLAAALSTIVAVLQANASIGARDIYQGIFKPGATPREMLLPSRIATLITAIVMFAASFVPGGPAPLLALMAVFMGVSAILFVVGTSWRRATPMAGTVAAFAGIIVGLLWAFVLPPSMTTFAGAKVFAGYPAALVTLVLAVGLSFVTAPKYYGRPEWRFGRERLAVSPEPAAGGD